MTRAINLLLIAAAATGLIFGGYWVGHAVWQTGEDNRRAVEGTQTVATTPAPARKSAAPGASDSQVRNALLITGAIVVLAATFSALGSANRHLHRRRRRERWHA